MRELLSPPGAPGPWCCWEPVAAARPSGALGPCAAIPVSSVSCCWRAHVMSISWCMFTWCLTTGQVLATSLAFFMTPLFSIAFAVLFLKEAHPAETPGGGARPGGTRPHALLPRRAALVLPRDGASFALYGLIKKKVETGRRHQPLSGVPGAVARRPARHRLADLAGHQPVMAGDWSDRLLLMGSAPATLLPVGLFCYAVARTPMSTVGLLQYIEPSLAFLLALFWFWRDTGSVKSVGFAFVWSRPAGDLLPCTGSGSTGRWRTS